MVNASNLLVLAKNEEGAVEVSVLDIGSSSGVDLLGMAERVADDVEGVGRPRRAARPTWQPTPAIWAWRSTRERWRLACSSPNRLHPKSRTASAR